MSLPVLLTQLWLKKTACNWRHTDLNKAITTDLTETTRFHNTETTPAYFGMVGKITCIDTDKTDTSIWDTVCGNMLNLVI